MIQITNSVRLLGSIGGEISIKRLRTGTKIARIPIVTSELSKKKNGEQFQVKQWHSLVARGKTAESMKAYLGEGSEVLILGRLTHRSFEDISGQIQIIAEVMVHEFMTVTRKTI